MQPDATPDWFEGRTGTRPIVVVAPHGGLRDRPIRRGDGMNDLHTASLARELAERMDGHALINHACDRNEIDLNRISQLVDRAPFFLARLHETIAAIHAGGLRPLVLLVHGWNMAVPSCDIGVGMRERGGNLSGRYPTVSTGCFDGFVRPLMAELADAGLDASIGLRYAAVGKDNATQLFSGRHSEHDDPVVAELSKLAADDHVDALQLELGIPLRWPGWRRDAFADVLAKRTLAEVEDRSVERRSRFSIDAGLTRSERWDLPPKAAPGRGIPAPPCGVQAVLPDGSGLFLGAEVSGPHTMAARVCLAEPDGAMLLFVAEGHWDGRTGEYEVAGLRWTASEPDDEGRPARVEVTLDGAAIRYPGHDAFVDLERGLRGAELLEAHVSLVFERTAGSYGKLSGSAGFGDTRLEIDEFAVCETGGRRAPEPTAGVRLHVTGGEGSPAAVETGNPPQLARSGVNANDSAVHGARVPVFVPVYRVLPDGRIVEVVFGTFSKLEGSEAVRGVFESIAISAPDAE